MGAAAVLCKKLLLLVVKFKLGVAVVGREKGDELVLVTDAVVPAAGKKFKIQFKFFVVYD